MSDHQGFDENARGQGPVYGSTGYGAPNNPGYGEQGYGGQGYGGPPPGQGYGSTAPMPPPGNGQPDATPAKGFFAAMFDFSFNHFVTPTIVKVVYVIATVLIGLGLLVFIISAFASMKAGGILVLIVGPIVALFYLAIIRMTLEFYLSIVRMSQDIHERMGAR